jgi:hypothetical protein
MKTGVPSRSSPLGVDRRVRRRCTSARQSPLYVPLRAKTGRPGWMAMRTSLKALSIQTGTFQDGNAKSENLKPNITVPMTYKNSPFDFTK